LQCNNALMRALPWKRRIETLCHNAYGLEQCPLIQKALLKHSVRCQPLAWASSPSCHTCGLDAAAGSELQTTQVQRHHHWSPRQCSLWGGWSWVCDAESDDIHTRLIFAAAWAPEMCRIGILHAVTRLESVDCLLFTLLSTCMHAVWYSVEITGCMRCTTLTYVGRGVGSMPRRYRYIELGCQVCRSADHRLMF